MLIIPGSGERKENCLGGVGFQNYLMYEVMKIEKHDLNLRDCAPGAGES